MDNKSDKIKKDTEPKKIIELKSKSGSIFERWSEDEENFVKCFSQGAKMENPKRK